MAENLASEGNSSEMGLGGEIRVDIYVAEGCHSCVYSREVATNIHRDFPAVRVRLIDISDSAAVRPEIVFATPTYLLNGQVWSLGNPSPQDVQHRLTAALADIAMAGSSSG